MKLTDLHHLPTLRDGDTFELVSHWRWDTLHDTWTLERVTNIHITELDASLRAEGEVSGAGYQRLDHHAQ